MHIAVELGLLTSLSWVDRAQENTTDNIWQDYITERDNVVDTS